MPIRHPTHCFRLPMSTVLSLCLLGSLSSCHTAFSRGFRDNHRLSPSEIKQIQFYTSGPIRLRRSENSQTRALEGHKFDIRGQIEVEEVEISSGTPCVAVDVRGEYIAVSFNPGDYEHTLWFSTVDSPDSGRYALTHVLDFSEGSPGRPQYATGYTLRYGKLDYQLVEPETWEVYLMFDEDVSLDRDLQQRSPDGWRLSETPVHRAPVQVAQPETLEVPVTGTANADSQRN